MTPPGWGHYFGAQRSRAVAAYSIPMKLRFSLLAAPWWLRGLVGAVLTAVLVTLLAWLTMPDVHRIDWLWKATLLVVVSVTFGAVFSVSSQPLHRRYFAIAGGLDAAQERQAVSALRSGRCPTDPAALAAALALVALFEPRDTKAALWRTVLGAAAMAWFACFGALYVWQGQTRLGTLWLVIAALYAGNFALDRRWRRRFLHNGAALRGDAAALPDGPEYIAAAAARPSAARLRTPARALLTAAVILVVLGASWLTAVLSRLSPDCRVARDAIGYVYDHRDLLDPNTIPAAAGHPPLTAYQQWSEQLQRYAGTVSTPEVAPRLHSIAQLSQQALNVVLHLRTTATVPSQGRQRGDMGLYSGIANQIAADENTLMDTCRLR
jgi:hypothetical protein